MLSCAGTSMPDTIGIVSCYLERGACPASRCTVQCGFSNPVRETRLHTLKKLLRARKSANAAVLSAFLLCGLYFASWCLITQWSNLPGTLIFYR